MKKNRMLIYGAGTLLVLSMFVGCGGNKGEKDYEKAMKAWNKGDLVQARTWLEKSTNKLTSDARKSQAYNKLGIVLWQLNEPKKAMEAFKKASEKSETITDATLNLAIAQFHSGEFAKAETSLGAFSGKYPDHVLAETLLGLIAGEKQDWAQASRLMGRAASTAPNDPAVRNAYILAQFNHDGNGGRAETSLERLIRDHPDYSPAYYNLAVLYDRTLMDTEKAKIHYRNYLTKAGNGSHAERAKQALALLDGSASDTADPAAAMQFLEEGDRLYRAGKYQDALSQFQQAVKANPGNKNTHYYEGLTYFKLKKYNEAVRSCNNALRLDPRYGEARYTLVYSYVMMRKWSDAEREARELVKVDADRGNEMLEYIESERN